MFLRASKQCWDTWNNFNELISFYQILHTNQVFRGVLKSGLFYLSRDCTLKCELCCDVVKMCTKWPKCWCPYSSEKVELFHAFSEQEWDRVHSDELWDQATVLCAAYRNTGGCAVQFYLAVQLAWQFYLAQMHVQLNIDILVKPVHFRAFPKK